MFETKYTKVQTDLIARALTLVGGDVEEVFIYMCNEDGLSSFTVFYRRGLTVGQAQQLDLPGPGPSPAEQEVFDCAGLDAVDALEDVCTRYGQAVPTELRVTYVVSDGRFTSTAQYEPVLGLDLDLGPHEVIERWMDDVRAGLARA